MFTASRASASSKPVSGKDQARTIAHLSDTVLKALGHIARHTSAAQETTDPKSVKFNLDHANRHVAEAVEHQRKLIDALSKHHPGVKDEISQLNKLTHPASKAPVPGASKSTADYDASKSDRNPVPG